MITEYIKVPFNNKTRTMSSRVTNTIASEMHFFIEEVRVMLTFVFPQMK